MRYSVTLSQTQDYVLEVSAPASIGSIEVAGLAIARFNGLSSSEKKAAALGEVRLQMTTCNEVLPGWSPAQSADAAAQGWAVFEHVSGIVAIKIHKFPDEHHNAGSFRTDSAARYWVEYRAEQGDELCGAAVAYMNHVNRGEG